MAFNLRVERWTDADIAPILTNITIPAFESYASEQLIQNLGTPPSVLAAAIERRRIGVRDHNITGIKCVHNDPSTKTDTPIASAEWIFYTADRPEEQYTTPHYLFRPTWVEDETARLQATAAYGAVHAGRVRAMGGRPHGLLMYMATRAEWRRKGAATACVRWGMDRCGELGIPALLEASVDGRPVYEALGFEVVDEVVMENDGAALRFPVMVWWPDSIPVEQRKLALPDWKGEVL